MKERIKIDSTILSFLIVLTGFLYLFPAFYATGTFWDQVFDIIGFLSIMTGVYLRMVSRGHKKVHSQEGRGLVTSGPYQHMRNPMYLGSFLLGCGYILLVWPWWLLPVFIWLFYLRFRRQIIIEEGHLQELFKQEYDEYAAQVPRLFPDVSKLDIETIRRDFPWSEAWLTKEKNGLWAWPFFGFAMELIQERIIFGSFHVLPTVVEFLVAVIIFESHLWFFYRKGR